MANKKNPLVIVWLPVIISIAVVVGFLMGSLVRSGTAFSSSAEKNAYKITEILTYIKEDYVDTVNLDDVTEHGISKMLDKLDPHTSYIPARDKVIAQSQLEGNFEGVGIEFNILKDTLFIVTTISGGPSEEVGLKSGDKIIGVDGKNIAGVGLDTRQVFDLLRGPKDSKVKLSVLRRGIEDTLAFTITREKIPTYSVDVSMMLEEETGFIKINRFAQNTHEEFKNAVIDLRTEGMKRLIIDLRDNSGGYLDQAVDIADELLKKNSLIVYTDGKGVKYDKKYFSQKTGTFETEPVVMLINEGSASASEILAGALQDNDRALLVGRRTFGKGLVQRPIQLSDESELRLTISRYYTPSGRSIQKSYEDIDSYQNDLKSRMEHGEFFVADSMVVVDSLKYKTLHAGRVVYGGGGISPDIFIAKDTTYYTEYLGKLYSHNILKEYALEFSSMHKPELEAMSFDDFEMNFEVKEEMIKQIVNMAENAGIKTDTKKLQSSLPRIKQDVKALIAKSIWKNEGFYKVYLQGDQFIKSALNNFDQAKKIMAAH